MILGQKRGRARRNQVVVEDAVCSASRMSFRVFFDSSDREPVERGHDLRLPVEIMRSTERVVPVPAEMSIGFQFFEGEAIEAWTRRLILGRQNDQDGALLAAIVRSPATAEDAFAVLPQDLRATAIRPVQRMRHHLSDSGVRLPGRVGCQPLRALRARGLSASHKSYRIARQMPHVR